MRQRLVRVLVVVRLMAVPLEVMAMPVVLVMDVAMRVACTSMGMQMSMPFGQVQPDTRTHQ